MEEEGLLVFSAGLRSVEFKLMLKAVKIVAAKLPTCQCPIGESSRVPVPICNNFNSDQVFKLTLSTDSDFHLEEKTITLEKGREGTYYVIYRPTNLGVMDKVDLKAEC